MAAQIVLLPTYNERENLPLIVPAIRAALPEADLLVVDDNSPDGTGVLADALAAADPHVRVLHRTAKEGYGRALVAAFEAALAGPYEHIFTLDADFSHDPASLALLAAALRDGAPVALGSRYVKGGSMTEWPWTRRLLSRVGNLYASRLLGLPYPDLTGGFKAFHRRVLEAIDVQSLRSDGYAFTIEVTFRAHHAGFVAAQVPIAFRNRRHGVSKMSLRIISEAAPRVLALRRAHRRCGHFGPQVCLAR